MVKKKKKKDLPELVSLDDYSTNKVAHWISTGIKPLDYIIHGVGGGIPSGRLTHIFGEESSGKSTLLAYIFANAQKMGFTTVLVDVENTFDEDFASRTGLDPSKLKILVSKFVTKVKGKNKTTHRPPDTIEELEDLLVKFLKRFYDGVEDPETPLIIGIDSLEGLQADARLKEGKHMISDRANAFSPFWRRLAGLQREYPNFTIVALNQIREDINMSPYKAGPKYRIPGGRAIKFYASLHIMLENRSGIYNENTRTYTGSIIAAAVPKSKIGKPFGKCFIYNRFERGFDNTKSSLLFLADNGILKKEANKKTSYRCTKFYATNLFIDGKQVGIVKSTKEEEVYEQVFIKRSKKFFEKYPWEKCVEGLK